MDIKYNVSKYKDSKIQEVKDSVSIEEPLEMRLKFKKNGKWETQNLSITMRTPGNDEDLIRGFLFNERIIENLNQIETTEQKGDDVGDYNLKNTIEATINNIENLDIERLKRNFLTNSSCGVCGKTSLDSIEILKKEKLDLSFPLIKQDIIMKSPNKIMNPKKQFIACSGRLNFELVQKALMANIGLMVGVGAPTSLAIDLAKRYNMTLLGFVKEDSFNIYSNINRVVIKS